MGVGTPSGMTDKAVSDLWWKDAVVYCADVATWLDSDGDGIGDLAGLTRRLDYVARLGATTLWLMPFYPSPAGRRRVRHHRLLRGRSPVRDAG